MKLATALWAAAAMVGAVVATDIDSGFTDDGATTYCMGSNTTATLDFDTLQASNVGRCPVGLTLTLTASEFHVNDAITVKWAARVNKGVSSSIFPNAIDASGLPGAVSVSNLWACTSGTNCATNVAGSPTGADGTSSGSFAADGTKPLETNKFTLSAEGDYIVVGIVALPGDASLFITAEEYVVLKKIKVVAAGTPLSSTSGSTNVSSHEGSSTTAPPTSTPSTYGSASSKSTGGAAKESTSLHGNSTSNSTSSSTDNNNSGKDQSTVVENSDTTTAPTTSNGKKTTDSSAGATTTSTSSGNGGFGSTGVILIAVLVGCVIVGVVGFAFVMRRRKERRMNANKGFDLNSPSMASDDDSALNGTGGSKNKIDLTYVANISARNNDKDMTPDMSDESSMAIMASVERGSELNSSNGSSLHSHPEAYAEKVSYGVSGAAGHSETHTEDYRASDMSSVHGQSEASMSNFGDSVVSARQNKYIQSGEWQDSESSRLDSRLDSMEQAELKARGFGSIGGFSTVSGFSEGGYSEDNTRITGLSSVPSSGSRGDMGFSMSSRATEESQDNRYTEEEPRFTQESRYASDYRFTEDSRPTEDSHVTEDSRATGFSEAMRNSRLQSEVSVDSYSFRPSRESNDSYSSGMSPYSREGSRISGLSVDLDSSQGSSNFDSSRGSRY